jgi:O-Antigen ligase
LSASLASADFADAPRRTVSARALRNAAVWLLFFSGFLVFIEPAPFEVAFGLVAIVFFLTGLKISLLFLPLIVLLLFYNIGGGLSLMPVLDETRAIWFVTISVYMAVMAIIIACIFSEDTERRLEMMKRGYTLAAVIASVAGIMGYFDVAGTFDLFTRYGRAMGTFKDPNVFSTFLVLPFVCLVQGYFLGTHRRPVLSGVALLIITAGLFLSFSRGAWGVAAGAVMLCLLLSFVTASSATTRLRIVAMAVAGAGLFALLLVIALQFEAVSATFEVRASLNQDYDQGETGRFGNQRRAIPLLLDLPNGFGPTLFRDIFPEDPHNTFLNAFSSYGWLGGISYLTLIAITMLVGWTLVFKKTPWQSDTIAVWSSFFFLMLQGLQIDTDHWRHFYVQLGLTWGLMLASLRYQAWRQAAREPTAGSSASTARTVRQ